MIAPPIGDSGGVSAAAIYGLSGSAKLNGLDPEAYLRDVLTRIADHPVKGGAIIDHETPREPRLAAVEK